MSQTVPETRTELALCVQLGARWSELLGVLPLYPDGNARVASALARLCAALAALSRGPGLALRFEGELLLIGGEKLQIQPGSKLHWLKQRFDRSMLAGLQLSPGVGEQALLRFSRRLVENFVRRPSASAGFAELWPAEIGGIELVPRRFEGGFGADSVAAREAPLAGGKAEGLVARLRADPGVLRALDELGEGSGARAAGGSLRGLDLLESVAALLPAEAALDPERAAQLTRAALERLGSAPADAHDGLLRLAHQVGRGFFGRASEPAAPPRAEARPPASARAEVRPAAHEERPEDRGLEADLELFERELRALDDGPLLVTRAAVDSSSEQLGVYLHVLAGVSDPGDFPGLEHGLTRLLAGPGAEDLAVLRQFLTGVGPLFERGRARIVAHLRRRGDTRWIRACGALDASWVVREFPGEFLDFVEGLDLAQPEAVRELCAVGAAIGAERIESALEALASDRRLVARSFTSSVLADRSGDLLPFARLVLRVGGEEYKEAFVGCLREARLDALDHEILEVVRRPAWLPIEYLLLAAGGEEGAKLTYQRQAVLCLFLRASDREPGWLAERVRAVRLLAGLPSVQVLRQLQRLVRERRLGLLPRHPRALRQAAREVTRAFVAGPLEWSHV